MGPTGNPYEGPAAPVPAGAVARAPWRAVALYAPLVNVAGSLVAGAASSIQFAYGLTRFGGIDYVPRVIALSALREYAPSGAFGLTCFTAVTVVHRASRSAPGPLETDGWRILILGWSIVLLYPVNVACIVLGATGVGSWFYALPAASFVAWSRESAYASDVAAGAFKTAVYGVIAMLLLPRALSIVSASRRGLALKLVLSWLAMQVIYVVVDASTTAIFAMLG
jgi:phospholipid/cholesterol/gamma-HCH transport system permease protein